MKLRIHAGVAELDAVAWDALRPDDNPFLAHAFLAGLEETGCLQRQYGWQSCPFALYEDERLVAAAPVYLKHNSHGEFVFDFSWANAYADHGLEYYPKLLCAVPYSPVSGPRLLVGNGPDSDRRRRALIDALAHQVAASELSSAHLNFSSDADAAAFKGSDWLPRFDWQFHWHNQDYADFEGFLATLTAKKRKNIRQERAQVARAGIECSLLHGDDISDDEWRALHHLYRSTFDAHANHATLNEAFFRHLGRSMPAQTIAVLARRQGRIIAGALFLRSSDTLYGRYWGSDEHVPGLHFEACYYQGIDYCIRHGLHRFEPGAQGEHKIARGFLPSQTHSFHWIADGRFRAAIQRALQQEGAYLQQYRRHLLQHSPYAEPVEPPPC